MAFRFLHASDLHLDTPFQGIGRAAPHVAEALRDASLRALDALVDAAIEEQTDFVLLAGDIYDGAERGLRAQVRLARATARLDAAGITTVIVHGNHDPVREGWAAVARWPARCHVLGADRVEAVPIRARDGTPVVVHGISYSRPDVTENLVRRFPRVGGDAFHVGLLHASLGAQPEHAAYSPCVLADLAATGHAYWALGHVHKRQVVSEAPFVAYAGNLQGRSFKSSEAEAKGALIVEVDGSTIVPRFRALDQVRFALVEHDVSGTSGVDEGIDALEAEGRRLQAQHARPLLIQVRLIGRGGVAEHVERAEVREQALTELRDRFLDEEPFVFWNGIDSDALPNVDLEALRGGGDLTATLISVADDLRDRPDDLRAVLEARIDVALRNHAQFPDPGELLREALLEAITRIQSTR